MIAQRVAEEVEADDDGEDGETGKGRDLP